MEYVSHGLAGSSRACKHSKVVFNTAMRSKDAEAYCLFLRWYSRRLSCLLSFPCDSLEFTAVLSALLCVAVCSVSLSM